MTGTIIKIIGDIYTVIDENNNKLQCSIRSTVKRNRIVIGDKVEIIKDDYDNIKYIITKVFDRKNFIPRPPIANIDKLYIVIAPKPMPDLLLVDKLIIYAFTRDITPILVVNKNDLAEEKFINDIKSQYYFIDVFDISAKNGSGIPAIINTMKGCFSAVCGQSAVGKSSMLNAIIPEIDLRTQGLSDKIDRGKHTTRVNEIYFHNDLIIADTPGFSSLDLDIDYKELSLLYPEFDKYLGKCRYLDCSHIKEGKDCEIIKAIENGEINKDRYDRYITLYQKLKENWEKKYD